MTDQKRRLGRGLEALLGPPPSVEEARAEGALMEIPLARVRANPYQPRREFDKEALADLANSLKRSGLLQPIIVRPAGDGQFELIAGERRMRAAQSLGWKQIGAVVRDVDNRTLLTLALVENLQRDQLSPIDEALGYRRLTDEFGMAQGDVADLVGKSRPAVANAMRLLRLPQAVQDLVHRGDLAMGHARALLQLNDPKQMRLLAEQAVNRRLKSRLILQQGRMAHQSEFLHMAVHDLRSPLAAMICYAELLMEGVLGNLQASQLEPIRTIHRNCQFLIDMVTDLLDSAKIGAGKLQLKLEKVGFNKEVELAVQSLRGLAGAKNIQSLGRTR